MNWNCNLEKTGGLKCKFGGLRAILELFLKNQGLKCKNQGLRVEKGKSQGVFCKTAGIIGIPIYFPTGKSVDRVHGSVDRAHDRRTVDRRPGVAAGLPERHGAGDGVRRRSSRMAGEEEGNTGVPFWGSPRCGGDGSGGATAAAIRLRTAAVGAH